MGVCGRVGGWVRGWVGGLKLPSWGVSLRAVRGLWTCGYHWQYLHEQRDRRGVIQLRGGCLHGGVYSMFGRRGNLCVQLGLGAHPSRTRELGAAPAARAIHVAARPLQHLLPPRPRSLLLPTDPASSRLHVPASTCSRLPPTDRACSHLIRSLLPTPRVFANHCTKGWFVQEYVC